MSAITTGPATLPTGTYRLDQTCGRIIVTIIAIDRKATHIVGNATAGRRMRGRHVETVITNEVDTNPSFP